jgi:hypothetical protein
MGSTEDPPDGGVVARTCLGAVVVYAVFYSLGNRANNRYFLHSVGVRLFCIGEPEQLSCGETCWTIEEIQALVFSIHLWVRTKVVYNLRRQPLNYCSCSM